MPSGYEPFLAPSAVDARVGELERQNALLREANAVLKQALAGVVERYKKLADQLPNAQCTSPRICDVYDEGFEPDRKSVV